MRRKGFILPLILIIIIVVVGAGIYFLILNKKSASTISSNNLAKYPQNAANQKLSNEAKNTINQSSAPEATIFYSDQNYGYGFKYPKSWKIVKIGSLTGLASLNNPNFQQCGENILTTLLSCDVSVSVVPYQEQPLNTGPLVITGPPIPSHDQQVKNLSDQIATNHQLDPITIGNLSGYMMVNYSDPSIKVLFILLQGNRNMIKITFPNASSKTSLNQEQSNILSSIVEQ